jgi:hypothetical protein
MGSLRVASEALQVNRSRNPGKVSQGSRSPIDKTKNVEGRIAGKVPDEGPEGPQLWPGGVPLEAWEILDPEIQEALREERISPEELPELVGWVDGP